MYTNETIQKIMRVKHRIKRNKGILDSYGPEPEKRLNYHGGYTIGYLQGKIAVLEEILDELKTT